MIRGLNGLVALLCLPLMVLPALGRDVEGTVSSKALDAYRNQLFAVIHYRASLARYRSRLGGLTVLDFTVDSRGNVVRSQVHRSSGDDQFDQLATLIVPTGLRFPPMPAGMSSRFLNVKIPLRFEPRY